MSIRGSLVAGVFAALFAVPAPASAQFGNIKDRIKQKVTAKTENAVDKAVDGAADKAISCVRGDDDCINSAKAEGKKVVVTDTDGKPVPVAPSAKASAAVSAPTVTAPGQGAWANYDFVPGAKVLFADDFAADRVGNFPRRLQYVKGNMEVVEKDGKRWLRMSGREGGAFSLTLPQVLPERFTMEFDATVQSSWCSSVLFSEADFTKANGNCDGTGGFIGIESQGHGIGLGQGGKLLSKRQFSDLLGNYDHSVGTYGLPFHVRLQVDGDYAKLYVGETRVANVPSIKFSRTNKIYFDLQGGSDEYPLMISAISVNAGGREIYDALMADGRVATQGIFFDVASDRLRPESTPTLQEIGSMLQQHADLKLEIQGHTDNTGQPASNRTLSEQRAAAVKTYLVSNFGIDAARLTSAGYGDTKPVAPNTTPEGKQQNRRVELVKR